MLTISGSPALGCTITGKLVFSIILLTIGLSSLGPREQFTPNTSTPNPSKVIAILSGRHPVKVLPFSSKDIVANIGKSQVSFAAIIAAFISYRSVIVSIRIKSAPNFAPALICLLKISTALSNPNVPIGSNNSPLGPISKAIKHSLPSLASLAKFIPCFITSSTDTDLFLSFNSLAPKVFVVITLEPHCIYSL